MRNGRGRSQAARSHCRILAMPAIATSFISSARRIDEHLVAFIIKTRRKSLFTLLRPDGSNPDDRVGIVFHVALFQVLIHPVPCTPCVIIKARIICLVTGFDGCHCVRVKNVSALNLNGNHNRINNKQILFVVLFKFLFRFCFVR